jgi:predicted Rossmann-fold nucleotide-binding protein
MKSVCVACGSNEGRIPACAEAARGLGAVLVERGLGLAYGMASVGIMGVPADDPAGLLDRFEGQRAPAVEKWIRKGEA